jgi:hypothetical protein
MSDDIGFKVYAVIDSLKASMGEAAASIEGFTEHAQKNIDSLSGGFKAMHEAFEIFLAALAVEKVEQFFDKFAQQATNINKLSIEFGLTSNAVQGLQFAMKATGGSGDELQTMLSRLSVAMGKAIDNAGPQRDAFNNLGISTKFLRDNSNDAQAVLYKLADGVKAAGTGAETTAQLIPLMGRGAAALEPALAKGTDGLKELQKAAEETGGTMNDVEKEQFHGMHESLVTMGEAFNGLGITIASAFAPAVQSIVNGLTEAISSLNGGSEHTSIFRQALILVVAPIDAVVLGLTGIKTALVIMWQTATLVLDDIIILFEGLGKVIDDFKTGHFSRMGSDWDETLKKMDEKTKEHTHNMAESLAGLAKTRNNMAAGLANLAGGSGEEKETPSGGKKKSKKHEQTAEEMAAAKEAAQQSIQLDQLEASTANQLEKIKLQTKKDALDAGVAAGEITKTQEIEQLRQLANEAYKFEQDTLNHQIQNGNLTVVQRQKIKDELLVLEAKHNQDLAKLNLQAVQAQNAQWKTLETTIKSSTDTMLQGVLQGTQTWQQAMANLMSNLAIAFVKQTADMAIHWAIHEATKTSATAAGTAARTASTVAGATAGKAAEAASAQTSIGTSAGKAAAAVYADVAAIPYIGWLLAPPAAAAAFVAVEAFGGGIASASGGFDIPAGVNPMTQLHQREMVLPADLADRVRGMTDNGGGGGGDVHFHVNAIDGNSVKKFFQNNTDYIAAAVKSAGRNFNSNVPSWK